MPSGRRNQLSGHLHRGWLPFEPTYRLTKRRRRDGSGLQSCTKSGHETWDRDPSGRRSNLCYEYINQISRFDPGRGVGSEHSGIRHHRRVDVSSTGKRGTEYESACCWTERQWMAPHRRSTVPVCRTSRHLPGTQPDDYRRNVDRGAEVHQPRRLHGTDY